jgi:predicted nucleic acid-binding protein
VVNLGETLYILARYFGERQARQCIQKTRNAVAIVSVDEQAALDAAMLRFRYKLSFADSFAAELAMRDGATLVTADPDFDKLGRQLRLLTLPRYSA